MTDTPLNILIISRKAKELASLKHQVRSFAPNSIFVIVKSYSNLKKKINWLDYHLIICDHQLDIDQAQKANIKLRIQLPNVPFVLITDCEEIQQSQFSKNPFICDIRAIILREQLAGAGQVLQSVFNNAARNIAIERAHQIRTRQRNLLLQKIECLMQQALLPLDTFRLNELSDNLFSKHKMIDDISSLQEDIID